MSDQSSPPPKPKPGSLRDRIAAFEKPTAASSTSPPPPGPRPKPGGISWKPKPPSPPSSPARATENAAQVERKAGGMSATDAKESIGKGGSLKDRMAALQGRGGFGAPPPPTTPKPAVEKPKWKPPPVVSPPPPEDTHTDEGESAQSPPAKPAQSADMNEVKRDAGEEGKEAGEAMQEEKDDPEEEEHQRRAAIAARMARLGGARVGMGAPVFGAKPQVRTPAVPKEAAPIEDIKDLAVVESSPEPPSQAEAQISPPEGDITESQILTGDPEPPLVNPPVRKSSESASIRSLESDSQASRSPGSMPLPTAPRRVAPPRKKPAKPVPAPPQEEKAESEDTTEAAGVTNVESKDDVGMVGEELDVTEPVLVAQETFSREASGHSISDVSPATAGLVVKDVAAVSPVLLPQAAISPVLAPIEAKEYVEEPGDDDEEQPAMVASADAPVAALQRQRSEDETHHVASDATSESVHDRILEDITAESPAPPPTRPTITSPTVAVGRDVASPTEEPTPGEDDEAARRKRVAERLAKMGGVNPFAPPPRRQSSVSSTDDVQASASPPISPTILRRTSMHKDSSQTQPPPPPPRRVSLRQSSQDSTHALEPPARSPTVSTHAQPRVEEEERADLAEPDAGSKGDMDTLDDSRVEQDVDGGAVSTDGAGADTRELLGLDKEDAMLDLDESVDVDHDVGIPEVEDVVEPTIAVAPVISPPPISPGHRKRTSDTHVPVDPAFVDNASIPSIEAPPVAARPVGAPTRSIPPPPRLFEQLTPPEQEDIQPGEFNPPEQEPESVASTPAEEISHEDLSPHRRFPPRSIPQDDVSDTESAAPLPVPHRGSYHTSHSPVDAPRDDDADLPAPRPHPAYARPGRPIPAVSRTATPLQYESDHEPALPTRPRRKAPTPDPEPEEGDEEPLIVPPRVPGLQQPQEEEDGEEAVLKPPPPPVRRPIPPPPPPQPDRLATPEMPSPGLLTPTLSVSDQEILDEEEGDPIDPAFHSPSRRASMIAEPRVPTPPPVEAQPQPEVQEEDAEQGRRHTIAERMAKLGGIRFGAAPLPATITRPPPPPPLEAEQEDTAGPSTVQDEGEPKVQPERNEQDEEEEEERARKARIATKLAGMGGMRIGMMPMGLGALPQPKSHALTEEPAQPPPVSPRVPKHHTPAPVSAPPPALTREGDSGDEGHNTSDDGVQVEAEESEIDIEEVHHEEAEEAPPPIPDRAARRTSGTVRASSGSRPPVPNIPSRKSSIQTTRKASVDSSHSHATRTSAQKPPAEYVMVDEPQVLDEEESAPPPPPRPASRLPPARAAPPPPPALNDPSDSISSQWELPSIPAAALEFGGETDLSLSWSEASASEATPSSPIPPPLPQKSQPPPKAPLEELHLSADDLIAVWGRVGVQICEVATSLFEKSKKSLVGDGTFNGFVDAVLSEVPNAAASSYGYVIYAQSGSSVQKRASDIMPGDIVELLDAKLKGHRGLQTYHQNVGAGEPLVGIVSEFEPKKSKVRVFQANQHVGQQTVESVSYRLEDLKSGTVKVYRVLEAKNM